MHIDGNDLTFRPHQIGFFLALAGILGAGLACLALGVTQHPGWFAGAALAAYLGVALASRYTAGSLALRGYDLVIIQGRFVTREVAYPLWQVQYEIRQTLIGRMLDAGTVMVLVGNKPVRCRVAQIRAVRRLVAERKLQILTLAERHSLVLPPPRARVLAGELEERPW
jgi:hypothetical protein